MHSSSTAQIATVVDSAMYALEHPVYWMHRQHLAGGWMRSMGAGAHLGAVQV